MSWKRILATVTAMALLLLVAGCSGHSQGDGEGTTSSSSTSHTDEGNDGITTTTVSAGGVTSATDDKQGVTATTTTTTAKPDTPVEKDPEVIVRTLETVSRIEPVSGKTMVTVHSLFCDHAVVQRKATVPVWGTGVDGETVTVSFDGQKKTTTVTNGEWRVDLDPMEACVTGQQMVIVSGDTTLVVEDVLIGEVWLGSGQSNMVSMIFAQSEEVKRQVLKESKTDLIREYKVTVQATKEEQSLVNGYWISANSSKVINFAAGAFFFAQEIHNRLGVPVGMIISAESATELELWVDTDIVSERNLTNPDKPLKEKTFYKGSIVPLFPYRINGILWYQGEDNVMCEYTTPTYQSIFGVLLETWREGFENEDIPVIVAQLPRLEYASIAWSYFRYTQMGLSQNLHNVYTTVNIDTGEADDIHPKDKNIVGKRMGLMALDKVYRCNVQGASPVYASAKVEGSAVKVTFAEADQGLVIADGATVNAQIKGADGQWKDVTGCVLEGEKTIVFSSAVKDPVGIRYAHGNMTDVALYDTNGLPVAPFYVEEITE